MSFAISFFGIFARIIDALAWPAVAVFLIWLLRDELRQAVSDRLRRPGRRAFDDDPEPKAELVRSIHAARDQAQDKLGAGVLGPEESEAARRFADQAQEAIVAIVSGAKLGGRPDTKSPAADPPEQGTAPSEARGKKKKKRNGPKGS